MLRVSKLPSVMPSTYVLHSLLSRYSNFRVNRGNRFSRSNSFFFCVRLGVVEAPTGALPPMTLSPPPVNKTYLCSWQLVRNP
ncbi:hypothetical protein Q3G72_023496 [Acer saccharum]|nr:hypothetical protein Q3G72_023496 [Acer saccharum]